MRWWSLRWPITGSTARASCSWYFARSARLRRRAFSVHWLCCSGVTSSSCPTRHGVRQSQDAMSQHGAHMREVERPLALAVGELDLALRQVCARLHGQARKPGRGRVEDPSHQVVPSIKERIINRFPIFLGGTDRAVELHQLVLELEEGGIVAGRIMFRHRVSSLGARTSFWCKAARKRAEADACRSSESARNTSGPLRCRMRRQPKPLPWRNLISATSSADGSWFSNGTNFCEGAAAKAAAAEARRGILARR